MIPYGRQNITDEDVTAVVEVLKSGFITQGPAVEYFEKKICEKVNCKSAVAVNSATSALHIACLALGLKKGDILWTSGISFVASANCGIYCGANVDFVDIQPDTVNICINSLEAKLKNAAVKKQLPKILIVVHMCGSPADLKKIHELSLQYKFRIIEDASHAIGAEYDGKKIGSCLFSDAAVFSFHPVKIVTTGEGGVITTNDNHVAQKLQMLRSHGVTRNNELLSNKSEGDWYYEQIDLGYNYRITDIQAALGISQLGRLENIVAQRNIKAANYHELLKDLPLNFQKVYVGAKSAYHLFVIQLDNHKNRKRVFNFLKENKIGVNVHYIPIYHQPYYQKFGYDKKNFRGCEKYYKACISLPLFPELSNSQQEYIAYTLSKALI